MKKKKFDVLLSICGFCQNGFLGVTGYLGLQIGSSDRFGLYLACVVILDILLLTACCVLWNEASKK
jgi:hypothetical protein